MRRDFRDEIAPETLTPPAACPVCHSKELTTVSKTITAASYWRCIACGEVWNVARLGAGSRFWPRYR